MARQRVPETIAAFNAYIENTGKRLVAINPDTGNPYWKDFNLSSAENTSWQDRRTKWSADLYPAYTSPETNTSTVKRDVEKFKKQFSVFAQPLLNKIVASGMAGNEDAAVFHIVLRRKDAAHKNMRVQESCNAALEGKGRGLVEVRCKAGQQERRSRIPKESGADSVQYALVVGGPGLGTLNPDDEAMRKNISTKAHFRIDLGGDAQAQWLYIYFRWYNTRKPALAGAWSVLYRMAIG